MNAEAGAPWFFVHLQKTGGTSLILQMLRHFAPGEVYPWPADVPDDPERPQLSVAALQRAWTEHHDRIRIIAGHFPFAAMELLGGGFTSLTLLRDPVTRTLSNIRSQLAANPRMEGLDAETVYERTRPFTNNHMLRMFSVTAEEIVEAEALGRWALFRWVDPTEERLDAAKANLERIDVVGFIDDLAAFVAELETRFGWTLGDPLHANPSPAFAIPDTLVDRIREENAPDLALYEYARSRRLHRPTGASDGGSRS